MYRLLARRPLPALVIALLALFVSLGGGAYAALSLPRNSVGTAQLRRGAVSGTKLQRNAVTSSKVKDHSLLAKDFKTGQLPSGGRGATGDAGAQGSQGDTGAQGPQGPAGAQGAKGDSGAQGPAGVGVAGLFGDGSQGDQTIAGATTLTHDAYYHDLTIDAGQTLNPGGYRIFVSGTLTLGAGARIARDGAPGGGTTGGVGVTAGTLGGGAAGGDMVGFPTQAVGEPNSLGGAGGRGDHGNPEGAVTPPAEAVGGTRVFDSALQALGGRSLDGALVNGGSGGGGGSAGGGGGGAGVIVVAARTIALAGSGGAITANGGAGGPGAGGGGGGVVVVVTTTPQPAGLTIAAHGGSGSGSDPSASDGFTDWLD